MISDATSNPNVLKFSADNSPESFSTEITEKIFSYLTREDLFNLSRTSKKNNNTVKLIMNDPHFCMLKPEYVWFKINGDYKPFKVEDVPIEKVNKYIDVQKFGRERIVYNRVKFDTKSLKNLDQDKILDGKTFICAKCNVEREKRKFDCETAKTLFNLSKKFFVKILGHHTTAKQSKFFCRDWDNFLPEFLENEKLGEEVYKNRFTIFNNIYGGLEELKSLPNSFFKLNEFVVIKNGNKFDCKRKIPLWLAFDHGKKPAHSKSQYNAEDPYNNNELWMAPELLKGGKRSLKSLEECNASNVYSFGIVMWCIYTRSIPFKDIKTEHIPEKVVLENKRPDLNRETFPNITDEEYSILKKLLEGTWKSEPKDRLTYEEIGQKLKELESASSRRE